MDIAALPSVPVAERGDLPPESGVYYGLCSQGTVLYIGQSTNLRQRWRYHETISQGVAVIAWALCSPDELLAREKEAITAHAPSLNGGAIQRGGDPVVSVRMPDDLRDRLSRRAEQDVRSLSQQIVWLLNYALEATDQPKEDRPRPAE